REGGATTDQGEVPVPARSGEDGDYYICHFRRPVPVAELVRVAGSRWGVEETFQFAKNETGLDHYQVRRYHAWYRHITLSMLAAAFLAVTAHAERGDPEGAPHPAMTS